MNSTNLFYILLLTVPLLKLPRMNHAVTQGKRSLLYVFCGLISLCWLWNEGFDITSNDIPVLLWFVYFTASLSWAYRIKPATEDWLQMLAFLVVYFAAKSANILTFLWIVSLIGPLGLVIGLFIRRKVTKETFQKIHEELGSKAWGVLWIVKAGSTFWPIGNASGAACIFALGTLASIYVINLTTMFSFFGVLVCNFLGLCVCCNKGSFLALILGCLTYVLVC